MSASLYENSFYGLWIKVFCFFSTEWIAWPQQQPQAVVLHIHYPRRRQELLWASPGASGWGESWQGHCGGNTTLLSFTKVIVKPDFVSTFVSSLLIFSVTLKPYWLMCFKGSRIYYCPPFSETRHAVPLPSFSWLQGERCKALVVWSQSKHSPDSWLLFLWKQFGLHFSYLGIFPLLQQW